jgi:hypothetical protein
MSDESFDDYYWRICTNKTKYDLNWEEIGLILNNESGKEYTSSKWRKNYQMMVKGYTKAIEKNTNAQQELEELEQARIELELEKKKIQTENIYKNRILRTNARVDLMYEKVADAIEKAELNVPEFNALNPVNIDSQWILGFSDIHAFKEFACETNQYSKEILKERMGKLLNRTISIINKENISELIIINGGDNLEGLIRKSQLMALEMSVIDSLLEIQRLLLEWLTQLSKHCKVKYLHITSANHSETRPIGSQAGEFPAEDLEKVIANYLKDMTRNNERIEVIVPKDTYYILEILDFKAIVAHGHGIKSQEQWIKDKVMRLRTFIDFGIFGHTHHESIKTIGENGDIDYEILRLPSIVGTDKYAESILKGSKSAGVMFKFERGIGRTEEKKIIL